MSDTRTTLLSARRVITGTGEPANAVLIRGGRIAAVGDRDHLRSAAPGADQLDLAGTTLTPGLIDAHIHLTEWALSRQQADLTHTKSPAEAVARLAAHPQAAGPQTDGPKADGSWLRGRGWSSQDWNGQEAHRLYLDESFAVRPVALQSHDMHSMWVNSAALATVGITRDTPDPPGGRIVRDGNGEPTGLLLENAAQLLSQRMPAPSRAEALDALRAGQNALHQLGFTGVHSFPPIHITGPDTLSLLQQLRESEELQLRVLQHFALDTLDAAIAMGIRSGFGSDWIRIGGVKLFLDGALGSRTAWMREPYEGSASTGVSVLCRADLREIVRRAAAAGIACAVHAIGDAAVALAVDELSPTDRRVAAMPHRIEHVQCCPPELLEEFARANIVCSMQPCHLMNDWPAADRHWGARSRTAYAFGSLHAHGATLAFGSDAPVEQVDPRRGLFAAVTRRDESRMPHDGWYPDERIDAATALHAFTGGPALAAGTAGYQGRLVPGAYADITAWTDDPIDVEPDRLLDIRCAATIVGGTIVFS